jgi:hypothetical protein
LLAPVVDTGAADAEVLGGRFVLPPTGPGPSA